MNKIFNLTSTFKSHEVEDGSVMIRGMASTNDFDRAGDTISPDAWAKGGLKNFENNPIILFNHDYNKPIGRATGLKVTPNGLELEAKISKSAPEHVCDLVKDGVLGAFSVGFRVKDADYLSETDGYKIKDAELFEVSVVSVPCNQAATFSLAKSFDSSEEYEAFKKTFTNRVDLASQSLAKDDKLSVASDTLDGAQAQKEIKMSEEVKTPEIDLEAFAKKVAEETAAKIAMKQAETKAAEEAAAQEAVEKAAAEAEAKAVQEEEVKQAVVTGVESGTEKLIEDVQKEFTKRDADMAETLAKYKKELEEKSDEIAKMRDSKRVFADRAEKNDISKWGQDFLNAHMLGVMTRKGWDTQYGRDIQEKAGIDYATNAGDIDQEVSSLIEKEIQNELRVARLFREIPVNGGATVLPISVDVEPATFSASAATSGNLENRGASNSTYRPKQVILNAYRLISSTFMDNDVDEQVLINLMPMLIEGVARAHGRAVENAILNGNSSAPAGLADFAAAATLSGTDNMDISDGDLLTAANLLTARKAMGKYGLNPSDVTYIVSSASYYDLLSDSAFQTLDEVGSDLAVRITGTIGAVFGSPVVVSEEFPADNTNGNMAAVAVYARNYVIPRLRGVTVEQDYEVMNQRRVIVATQSLGFEEIVAGASADQPSVRINFQS
jgi:HK97 family phage prohead protease/HK97 family phage major capsid protein